MTDDDELDEILLNNPDAVQAPYVEADLFCEYCGEWLHEDNIYLMRCIVCAEDLLCCLQCKQHDIAVCGLCRS